MSQTVKSAIDYTPYLSHCWRINGILPRTNPDYHRKWHHQNKDKPNNLVGEMAYQMRWQKIPTLKQFATYDWHIKEIEKRLNFSYRNHKFLVTSNMNAWEWATNPMTICDWWTVFILRIFQQGMLHATVIIIIIILFIICLMAKVHPTKSLSITAYAYLINYTVTV